MRRGVITAVLAAVLAAAGLAAKALVLSLATAASARAATPAAYPDPAALATWRAERIAGLTAEDGWLTLVGLLWLEAGDQTFGRAAGNALVLDHPALPATVGTFHVRDRAVSFTAADGADVRVAGAPVTTLRLSSDRSGAPTLLDRGPLRFHVIERAGRLAIRVRDRDSPRRRDFAGLQYFPATADWLVTARFEAYTPARTIPIMNVLGYEDEMSSPGVLVFEKDGREWRLDAILERPDATQLFVMFADGTTGRETYGAGRFLYAALPRDGRVTLDFNRAYGPPCAFNLYATCPLPPAQNRLGLRIEAGELKYAGEH
jgi:uncharacterized protein (DUF1684 family)